MIFMCAPNNVVFYGTHADKHEPFLPPENAIYSDFNNRRLHDMVHYTQGNISEPFQTILQEFPYFCDIYCPPAYFTIFPPISTIILAPVHPFLYQIPSNHLHLIGITQDDTPTPPATRYSQNRLIFGCEKYVPFWISFYFPFSLFPFLAPTCGSAPFHCVPVLW